MTTNNIKVSIKIRPLIQREKNDNLPSLWSLVDENTIKSNNKEYKLSFDHIFDETRKTEELFNSVAKPIVENAVKGINGTIFAYGQTSSGKTYCMMGTDEEPGIIPLTVKEIFNQIKLNEDREFLIRVGYIEIYNEKIFDLLDNKVEICKIHEPTPGEVVINQTELVSSSIQHILENYDKGNRERRVGETCMNERSSRSHTLFKITIESHENGSKDGVFQVSTLNLVDLAGSERVDQTKATGERLREGGHINKSLLSLSKVIRELSDLNDDKLKNPDGIKYINYRDSKLTRILSASLGGNAMTAIICTITPVALEETYSTLTFASNAKKIKNQPKVNETVSDKVIMTRLQKEISDLKGKLEEERSKNSEVSKIQKLISQIFDRESQIIHCQPGNSSKSLEANRRRTWCPTTHDKESNLNVIQPLANPFNSRSMAPPPFILKQKEVSPNAETVFTSDEDFLSNEIFQSPDKIQFDNREMLFSNSRRNTLRVFSPSQIRTPRCLKTIVEVDSPHVGKTKSLNHENEILKARIKYLENELEELQDFKMLENNILTSVSDKDIKELEDNLEQTKKQLFDSEQKVDMLENDMMDKMIEIENLKDLKKKYELMTVELNKANQDKQLAENILESVKYEYEQAQNKFKNRENELIQLLNEARNESAENENTLKNKIKNLEQTIEVQISSKQNANILDPNKLSELETNIKELEAKLQSALNEKEKSEQALNEKNTELETLSDQIVESVQEIDSLEDRLKKMDEMIKIKDNEFVEITTRLAELEGFSNRYQIIQQIVTVDDKVSEFAYDESDVIYKRIVDLKQTAIKIESLENENKQLVSEITKNNQINEEVEILRKKIANLEELINNKSTENENLSAQLSEHENMTNRLQKIQNLLLSDEPALNDDENDDVCKLIIKLHQKSFSLEADKFELLNQINANQGPNIVVDDLRKQIDDLKEEIKLRDSQKESLQTKLTELERIASHYQKVRDSLQSTDEQLENSDVIKQITDLHRMASRTELLENEKAQLLNEIAEIRHAAEILTEKLQNQTLSETEFQLRERIEVFEAELKDAKERLDEQIVRNNELESNNLDLEIKIEEALNEKEDILSQIEKLKNSSDLSVCNNCNKLQEQINESSAKIHAYENEISQLTSKLDEAHVQNNELASSNKNHIEQLINFETELKDMKELLEHAKSETSNDFEYKEMHELAVKENNELLVKIEQLELDIEIKSSQHEKLQQHLDENINRIAEFENEVYKLSLKLDEAKVETAKEMELKAQLQAKLDEITESNGSSSFEVEQLKADLELKHNECSTLQVQLNENIKKIEDYEKEFQQLNAKCSSIVESSSDLNAQVEEIVKEKDDLLLQIEQFQDIIKSKDIKLEEVTGELHESDKKVKQLENEIIEINSKCSTVAETSTDLHAQIDKINKEKEDLLLQIDQFQDVVKSKNSELKSSMNQLTESSNKINELEKQISEITSEYSKAIEASSDLKAQFEEILTEKNNLLLQNEEFQNVMKSKDTELEALTAKLCENAKKIEQHEHEIAEINSKFSTATESSSDLHIQIEELVKDKENLTSAVKQLEELLQLKVTEYEGIQLKLNENVQKLNHYENEISQLSLKFVEISTQNTKLLESNSDFINQVSKLNAELTNSQSQNLLKDEEFKNLQKEVTQMTEQLKQKMKECEELKTRYRRRSEDNERKMNELEVANSRMLQEVGAAEAHRISTENDLKKLKEEFEKLYKENNALKEDNNNHDMKYTILDEKYSQLSATNLKLENKVAELKNVIETKNNDIIKKLEKEIIDLNAKVWQKSTENEGKAAIILELNQKCEQLIKEVENSQLKPKKSFSPSHRRSDEKELFAPQHTLQVESNTPSRALKSNYDRKSRRQSVYDERRDLSAWELTQSESTQTDPVDKLCRCDELNEIIKELRIEIRLRDSMIANHKRMANVNIYKYQLEDAKTECQKEKRENCKLRDTIEKIDEKLRMAKSKIQELERNQRSHDITSQSIQTDIKIVLKDEYEKIVAEKNVIEKKLAEVEMQLIMEKKLAEKENLSQNSKQLSSSENEMSNRSNRSDYDSLYNDHLKLQKKYETAKRLCNLRQDDLNKLREEVQNRTLLFEKLSAKYERAKQILEIRMEKIRCLRERLGDTDEPDSITSN